MASRKSTNYSCDTIPEPQHLAIGSRQRSLSPAIDNLHINTDDLQSAAFDVPTQEEILSQFPPAQPVSVDPLAQLNMDRDEGPPGAAGLNTSGRERKLCVRHLRMADEGTFSKLQQVSRPAHCHIITSAHRPPFSPSLSHSKPCPSLTDRQSTLSGRRSPHHHIRDGPQSSRASSPCAASASFPISPNNSIPSSDLIRLAYCLKKYPSRFWDTSMHSPSAVPHKSIGLGPSWQTMMSYGVISADSTSATLVRNAAGVYPFWRTSGDLLVYPRPVQNRNHYQSGPPAHPNGRWKPNPLPWSQGPPSVRNRKQCWRFPPRYLMPSPEISLPGLYQHPPRFPQRDAARVRGNQSTANV
jgi:hypothetical protein